MESIMGFPLFERFGFCSVAVRPICIFFCIVDPYKTIRRNGIVIQVFLNQLFYQLIPFFCPVNIGIITIPRIDNSSNVDVTDGTPIFFTGI